MKLFSKIFPPKYFSVMDIGAENALIVIADKKDNGELRLLGGGEAPLQGMEKGEVVNPGDFVESITRARDQAENSAGAPIRKLYYNLDDRQVQSAWPIGSRILDGEGEIQVSDVRAAVLAAERLAGNFEKKIVYAAEVDYVIDDKDPVADPIGIFGHKLDVKAHLVMARAERLDAWSRFFRRVGFEKTAPVLSGISSAYGVLTEEERWGQRILWDLGKDYLTGVVMGSGRVWEYRSLLTAAERGTLSDAVLAISLEFKKKYPQIGEVVLTGEFSKDQKWREVLKDGLDIPVRSALPRGLAKLNDASNASIAGLLHLAGEIESKAVVIRPEKNSINRAREKMRSLLSDYF